MGPRGRCGPHPLPSLCKYVKVIEVMTVSDGDRGKTLSMTFSLTPFGSGPQNGPLRISKGAISSC